LKEVYIIQDKKIVKKEIISKMFSGRKLLAVSLKINNIAMWHTEFFKTIKEAKAKRDGKK